MDWLMGKSKAKPNGKKPGAEEKKVYLEPEHARSRIADFAFKELVALPREIDLHEWLASNTTTFFHHINLQYSTISEFCTGETCQTMAVCNTQYYWYDERGKKVKCTAPQYVDFVMSSVQKLVTDEDVFPTKQGIPQLLRVPGEEDLQVPVPRAGPHLLGALQGDAGAGAARTLEHSVRPLHPLRQGVQPAGPQRDRRHGRPHRGAVRWPRWGRRRGPGGTEPREGEMSGPDRGAQVQGTAGVCECSAVHAAQRGWGPGCAEHGVPTPTAGPWLPAAPLDGCVPCAGKSLGCVRAFTHCQPELRVFCRALLSWVFRAAPPPPPTPGLRFERSSWWEVGLAPRRGICSRGFCSGWRVGCCSRGHAGHACSLPHPGLAVGGSEPREAQVAWEAVHLLLAPAKQGGVLVCRPWGGGGPAETPGQQKAEPGSSSCVQ